MSAEEKQEPIQYREIKRVEGPLLPRWLSVLLYAIFVPLSAFGLVYIGRSAWVQHNTVGLLRTITGPWEGEMPPMDSEQVQGRFHYLERKPRNGLLYVIEELLQDAIRDPRMARAIVLKRALQWATQAEKRLLFEEILANMSKDGEMRLDYVLPEEHRQTLEAFLNERAAQPRASYEDRKITEVLQWVAEGRPTAAKGPEIRRIKSLQTQYEKKIFAGRERRALEKLAEQWGRSDEPVPRGAAQKFARMLRGKYAELSHEEKQCCLERAKHWEGLYLKGQERLTQVAARLARIIQRDDRFLDHPELWDLVRLLYMSHQPARRNLAETIFVLRTRRFILIYLSQFLLKDTINPVMAAETARLTKSEHEALLRDENLRRRLACIELAGRIALDYCREPFEIRGIEEPEREELFKDRIIRALQAVIEDEEVGKQAQQILDAIPDACKEHSE